MLNEHIIPVGTLLFSDKLLCRECGIYISPFTEKFSIREAYFSTITSVVFIRAVRDRDKKGDVYYTRMELASFEASTLLHLLNVKDIPKFVDIPASMISFINVLSFDGSMELIPIITLNGKHIGLGMYNTIHM